MKNREKYKNELIKVIKKDGKLCEFVKKHEVFRMFGKDSTSYCKMTCVTCATALQLHISECFSVAQHTERKRGNKQVTWLLFVIV